MIPIIKFFDRYVGNTICNFLGLFNRKTHDSIEIKKILVVQLWGIGETILALPAIEALRKRFPKAEINALATSRNKDVFFGNKNVDDIIVIRLNPFSALGFILKSMKKYGLVIDMEEYLNVSAVISFF